MLPAIALGGQNTFKIGDKYTVSPAYADPTVTFDNGKETFSVSWELKTMSLVVKADEREHRISAKEIMDTLGTPPRTANVERPGDGFR
jgi:hypothetical protein